MRKFLLVFFLALATLLAACSGGGETQASISEELNELLQKDISLTPESKVRISELREHSERLRREGKEKESLNALKQVRDILRKARDADLLRKSEG